MSKIEKRKVWYIFSRKKNAIWQRGYDTYDEAKKEYDHQMALLSADQRQKADWKIEGRVVSRSKEEDDELANF